MGKPIAYALIFLQRNNWSNMMPSAYEIIHVSTWFLAIWTFVKFCKRFHRSYLRRMFHAYIGYCIKSYQRRHWGEHNYPIPEVNEIASYILNEMMADLAKSGEKVRDHAMQYGAILYCGTIHIPWHISNSNLYMAIDVLKAKFYSMYGIYLDDDKKDGPRNNFLVGVQSKRNEGIAPIFFRGFTVPRIMEYLANMGLDDPADRSGTDVRIEMSVLTTATRPGYSYRRHCA